MSFNTALSGLQAAATDLSVISNNIANVSTTGFKYSRSEFEDIYAVSPFGNSPTAVGNGVQLANVSQQFSQGNFEFTDNSLDLALSGQGFFITSQGQGNADLSYTRAGEFRVNDEGFLVSNTGSFLQAFPVNIQTGEITSTSLSSTQSIQLPSSTGAPLATTEVEIGLNLDADTPALDPTQFDPAQAQTYTHSTSSTVYDSLGESHVMTYYFVNDTAASNRWQLFTYLDGNPIPVDAGTTIASPGDPADGLTPAEFNFRSDGSLDTASSDRVENLGVSLSNGAANLNLLHDFANNSTTQYSADFSVSTLNPDGYSTGRLSGLDISEDGLIRATYTNGTSTPLGRIALADFPNTQGLVNAGGTSWNETTQSGAVIAGEAGTGRFGLIQSGALEASNVDLTQQLVNLITAQRNFQANARSIETSNTLTQTIVQIR
jgi:flagellar hook protein FlgE